MSSSTAYILYLVFTLGAVGVYFLLPRAGRSKTLIGAVFGLSAVAALITLLAARISGGGSAAVCFYLFAVIAVIAAARVITHPKPVYCAIYLVLLVVAVAALLVLQQAEFLAIALILVYAGAIMVTYLFVIMLAQPSGATPYDRRAREPLLAVLAGFVLMAAVAGKAGELPERATPTVTEVNLSQPDESILALPEGNTAAVGGAIMTRYVVALEIAGLLLLVAMIGAIALSKKVVPADPRVAASATLGRIGKEVEPF